MADTDWSELRAALEGALERPAEEREAHVRARLGARPELAERALRMLAQDAAAGEEPARLSPWPTEFTPTEFTPSELAPERLGPWRIEGELGRGGMGTVYAARRDDGQFEMRAAVKLLRHGLAGEDARQLFLRERQLLARLEHPGIARLLDGGLTPDGRPYLVMERVDGLPLDRHGAEKRLDLRARIELFLEVCAAVESLHAHGIVHRDLKPGNVLVTAEGRPKLLDFGIAKVLATEEAEGPTVTAGRILTPGYASPEQVRGEPIGPASDVYSLGVMLYELLAGRRPYRVRSHAPSELERAICEQPPRRPSVACRERAEERGAEPLPEPWARKLRGDLDTLVLQALRKEPERRYASVAELADDLRRHLDGRPVRARPAGVGYRLSRLVARHRAASAALGLLALALAVGLPLGLRLFDESRAARLEADALGTQVAEERERSAARYETIRALSAEDLLALHDRLARLEGSAESRRALVDTVLAQLDALSIERPDDGELRLALARTWRRVGLTQGDPHWESLGEYDAALESLLEARRHAGEARALLSHDARPPLELARIERHLGDLYEWLGRKREALAAFESARALAGRLEPGAATEVLGPTLRRLVALYEDRGRFDDARAAREAALPLYAGGSPVDDDHARSLLVRAEERARRGEHDAAIELTERALQLLEDDEAPADAGRRLRRAQALVLAGESLTALGEHAPALARLDQAVAERESMARLDPRSLFAREGLAGALEARGDLRLAMAQPERAFEDHERALDLRAELASEHAALARLRRKLAERHDALGTSLRRAGFCAEALEHHLEALPIYEELAAADPESARARRDVSVCLYAEAFARLGLHGEEARPLAERAAELQRARDAVARSRELLIDLQRSERLAPEDAVWIERMEGTLEGFDGTLDGYREQGLLN